MDKKELSIKDIDVDEVRDMAIRHYVDDRPITRNPQVEAIIKAFLRYCKKYNVIVENGKVFKHDTKA